MKEIMARLPYIDEELIGNKVIWKANTNLGKIKKGDTIGKVVRLTDDSESIVLEVEDEVHDMISKNISAMSSISVLMWEQE